MTNLISPSANDRLLASIAVFAELCDSKTDIQSIIVEFISSLFTLEETFSLSTEEAVAGLRKHYEFDLPEAVVKTCLNRMKRDGLLTQADRRFTLVNPAVNSPELAIRLVEKRDSQHQIEEALISYFEKMRGRQLTDDEKQEITNRFIGSVLGRPAQDEIGTVVSSFIVEYSSDPEFVSSLNEMREGIVLVTGLKYSQDLNELGQWKSPLTVYLDTEILFNAVGYNGEIYKRLFDDFHSLVREVNRATANKSSKDLIQFKYFQSVADEIERFFNGAERIIRREQNASPESGAMEEILRGCKDASDVVRKKADFETKLRNLRIRLQEELDYYSRPEFNVEDASLIDKYSGIFSEHDVADMLRAFTKINFLRGGVNNTMFEKCGHIILTGKYVASQLGKDLEVKFGATDIPFSTDLYFITNRLWFRLNKGLSKDGSYPSTLDVVTNARISISSQLNRSVREKYDKLKSDVVSGHLSPQEAQQYNHHLREKAKLPDEITAESVKDSVHFLYDEADFQNFIHTSLSLREQSKELVEVKDELRQMRRDFRNEKRRPLKSSARKRYKLLVTTAISLGILVVLALSFLITSLVSSNDTWISILAFLIPVVGGLLSGYRWLLPRVRSQIRGVVTKKYLAEVKSS